MLDEKREAGHEARPNPKPRSCPGPIAGPSLGPRPAPHPMPKRRRQPGAKRFAGGSVTCFRSTSS